METLGTSTSPAPTPPAARPFGWGVRAGLAVLVACALAAVFWPRQRSAAPGGFLLDAGGRPSPMATRLSPVTLVHFWATWCPPCIEEIPALQRLARDLSGHPDFGLLMVAVADEPQKVANFLGPGGDMVLFDPTWDVAHRYGTKQVPETYLVVRGRVLEKFVGQTDWDDPAIRRRIEALAGGAQPPRPTSGPAGG
jgi:thiol-disulfide isomerase/thioredoxin